MKLHVYRLGRVPYDRAHALQKRLQLERLEGKIGDTLLTLEHDPVITLGRRAKGEHILFSKEALAIRGVSLVETGRGGDVTFHGPGQLVVYPIIDLKPDKQDVRKYVYSLEETMIRVARDYGLNPSRKDKLNGAWLDEKKIGAVGVRLRNWVTMHGFALNVNVDLDYFNLIIPCGIQHKGVTSLSKELQKEQIDMEEVIQKAANHFAELYEVDIEWQSKNFW